MITMIIKTDYGDITNPQDITAIKEIITVIDATESCSEGVR